MSKVKIHGVGEAIYDLIFRRKDDGLQFMRGCGGGSVGNFLANCASRGYDAVFHGTQGGSLHGELAMDDLERYGVTIGQRQQSNAKDSHIIFEIIEETKKEDLFSTSKHKFSLRCPVCGVKPKDSFLPKLEASFFISLPNFSKWDVLAFDKITNDRAKLGRKHFKNGGLAVLDLGHIGALRYRKPEELVWNLNSFNVIHTSESIVRSLAKRVGSTSGDSLFRHLLDHLLIISDGAERLRIVRVRDGVVKDAIYRDPPDIKKFVDDAGAGDTLFSWFLCALLEQSGGSPRNILRFGAGKWDVALNTALAGVEAVIACEGARCHLKRRGTENAKGGVFSEHSDKSPKLIQAGKSDITPCFFCHRSQSKEEQESGKGSNSNVLVYSRNVEELRRQMQKEFSTDAIDAARRSLPKKESCLVVGTGGSFPVAQFISDAINETTAGIAFPLKPLEYLRKAKRVDRLIVISYSGKTEDCRMVVEKAIECGVGSIHLVTRSQNPILGRSLRQNSKDTIVSYEELGKKEGGFVSSKGTVMPCALYLRAVSKDEDKLADVFVAIGKHFSRSDGENFAHVVQSFFSKNLIRINSGGVVEVFGTGVCLPAMQDLESKFAEGGLNVVRLHESKDFSHGRFMAFRGSDMDKKLAIVFAVGSRSTYERELAKILKGRNVPVLEVCASNEGLYGSFELLFLVQYVVKILGDVLKKDISKPKSIPQWGLQLYNWPNLE